VKAARIPGADASLFYPTTTDKPMVVHGFSHRPGWRGVSFAGELAYKPRVLAR
jgi:hypothetical protein